MFSFSSTKEDNGEGNNTAEKMEEKLQRCEATW